MHEYESRPLHRSELAADPIEQFVQWFRDAERVISDLPEGAALATVDAGGQPSIRTVLLKGFENGGFVFFTNYESRKGRELEANRHAALLLWWRELARQIRIEGRVEKVPAAESDAYFATRPRGSQIAAWASDQSEVIATRDVLVERANEVERRFDGREVTRPPHWGGYRVDPELIEFWQGQPSRLHDRFAYVREPDGSWRIERLAP